MGVNVVVKEQHVVLVVLELFSILTGMIDTQTYICEKSFTGLLPFTQMSTSKTGETLIRLKCYRNSNILVVLLYHSSTKWQPLTETG